MAADRTLTTVLRLYQGAPEQDHLKILGTTAWLLHHLSNPLNLTLLTSQLLISPGIWSYDRLQTSQQIINVYRSAGRAVHSAGIPDTNTNTAGGGIGCDDWATFIVKGLDDRSPRWKHALVLAGVLEGMEGQDRRGLSSGLRTKLENALVTATNMVLMNPAGHLDPEPTILALIYGFPLLSNYSRDLLNYDALLLPLVTAMVYNEGYQNATFLESVDKDILPNFEKKLNWSSMSPSFLSLQRLSAKPLVSMAGPLSGLAAHAIENSYAPKRVLEALDFLVEFSGKLLAGWRSIKLSKIDASVEATSLSPETLRVTNAQLWSVLKSAMFATINMLRSILAKTLRTPFLSENGIAPGVAFKSLTSLRNLHFISSRLGSNALTAYTFVHLTSIDILSRFPPQAGDFLRSIAPNYKGQIPSDALQRNHDLFYFNTVEHFTVIMSPTTAESLVVDPASSYLQPTMNAHVVGIDLLEIFEAAHSATLAALAAPQNGSLAAKVLPSYTQALFNSFPANLSPRQFRFAFKALIQITTPPNQLAASQPLLSESLLELLHYRAIQASTTPLPPSRAVQREGEAIQAPVPLSEQAVLLLTLIDALPSLPIGILEPWLTQTAETLNEVQNHAMRTHCKARLQEVLSNGEMDVERSALCVGWWTSRGGREMVMWSGHEGAMMSGALGPLRESNL